MLRIKNKNKNTKAVKGKKISWKYFQKAKVLKIRAMVEGGKGKYKRNSLSINQSNWLKLLLKQGNELIAK